MDLMYKSEMYDGRNLVTLIINKTMIFIED